MSAPATSYQLFYPDSNTVTTLNLFAPDGSALTPQAVTDGAGDPAGWKSKVITFAAPAEALFATPTFQDPGTPVSVYLTRDDAGSFKKVLDEILFDSAAPGRPTPPVTAKQEYLLYDEVDDGGGIRHWTVKPPLSPVAVAKKITKDPVTGAPATGNDILLRWSGPVAALIEVECDVEDITDPQGFLPFGVTNVTTYSESSVGLSLVKVDSQIVPQDGQSHLLYFRLRYNIGGDVSAWQQPDELMVIYEMDPPNAPDSLTATLLRDRYDSVPDVVGFAWAKAATNPGSGIDIVCYDYLGKKHTLYTSNGPETECRIDNVSRFVVQDEGPAVPRPYRFAIIATNTSTKSDETFAPDLLNITSKVKTPVPLTPDEIAGTAVDMDYPTLKAAVFSDVLSALGTLPAEGQSICSTAMDLMLIKIKDIISKGGNVSMQDFGIVAAKWTSERLARNPATGEPVIVPAYRSLRFTPSAGFKTGTRNGTIMTDAQASA